MVVNSPFQIEGPENQIRIWCGLISPVPQLKPLNARWVDAILSLRSLKQGDFLKFEASLNYIARPLRGEREKGEKYPSFLK